MAGEKLFRGIQAGVAAIQSFRARALAGGAQTQSVTARSGEEDALVGAAPGRSPELLAPTVIRTSEKDWLARLTGAYRRQAEVELIDDASIGIDPGTQSLLQMGLAGKLTHREWSAVTLSGGMTVFGAGMVVLAILDPEPTSKLGLLVGSGALLALTGGFQTVRLLTHHKPPSITLSARGVHIEWR